MVNGKQFYHQGKEEELRKKDIHTRSHTHLHTQRHETAQSLHKLDEQKLVMIKLRTVQQRTEDLRTQSVDGDPGRGHSRMLGVHREENKASKHKLKQVS